MDTIKETPEMTKYQKQAKFEWETNKTVDVAAALLGWKVGAGKFENNMIVNPSGTKTIKILAEVSSRLYKVDFNGQERDVDALTIARAIVKENWQVGYSH